MRKTKYIVEGANWKCEVSLKDDNLTTEEQRILEACTLCFEYLFKQYDHKNIDLYSLINEYNQDYFESEEEIDFPEIVLTVITMCYKKTNKNKPKNHYFVLTELIAENAGMPVFINPIKELKKMKTKENPEFKKFLNKYFKNSKIVTNVT